MDKLFEVGEYVFEDLLTFLVWLEHVGVLLGKEAYSRVICRLWAKVGGSGGMVIGPVIDYYLN